MINDSDSPESTYEWNSKTDMITPSLSSDQVARFCTSFISAIKLIQFKYGQGENLGIISALNDAFATFSELVKTRVASGHPVEDLQEAAKLNMIGTCMATSMFLTGDEIIALIKLGNSAFETVIKAHDANPEELKEGAIRIIVRANGEGGCDMAVTVEDQASFMEGAKKSGIIAAVEKTLGVNLEKKSKTKKTTKNKGEN